MNLDDLASFVLVVELGTITGAAEAEGVSKSTISRRISRLEDALGIELLRRTARSFNVTDDGRSLHARATGPLRDLLDVTDALSQTPGAPRGRLVFTAPHDLGNSDTIIGLLTRYREQFPDVVVDVRLENRVVDLIMEGVDVGLRAHGGEIPGDPNLMSRHLGKPIGAFYASPTYLQRHGVPQSFEDLSEHIIAGHSASQQRPSVLLEDDVETVLVPLRLSYVVNDFSMLQGIVQRGAAIAVLPSFTTRAGERRGELVRVLPRHSVRAGQLSLVWPASRHLAPRVRAFVDLATAELGPERW